jgi:thiamine biosynthesis lipoprotein
MTQPRSTRRSFLRGGAAVEALAAWADGATVETAPAEPLGERYLVEFSRRAMATSFSVLVDAKCHPESGEAAVAALDLIESLEDQLTVYRDHSEVMQINRLAGQGPVIVEPRLYALFQHAARLYEQTSGAFDITAGPLAKVWGFYRRQGAIPADADLAAALACVGMNHVELDDETRTIEFTKPGMEINLGAIGKGYALDRAAELLVAAGVENFLLHGGASSVLGRGTRNPGPDVEPPPGSCLLTPSCSWQIGIGDPQRPGERLAFVDLRDRAIGTSGAAYQSFRHQGRRYGHIIDPRTGRPAEGVLSATVVAPTAAEADALSTALYVLGPEASEQFLAEHQDIAAILVLPTNRPGKAQLRAYNFAEDALRLADEGPRIED